MIVQEFLKQADIEKQVELIMASQPSYEEPYDKDKVRENMTEFINMLLTLTPKVSDDYIMIYQKYYDTDIDDEIKEYSIMELYKKDELQKSLDKIHGMENPVTYYNESMSKDDLKGLVQKYDFMPHGYGYEFNEWEETLGYEVYTKNLTAENIQDALYNILYEMTFNGMTRETQEERKNELDDSIKETEELLKLPEEERKKHFKDAKELFELFDDVSITKKELNESERLLWYCSLKSCLYLFDLLKGVNL